MGIKKKVGYARVSTVEQNTGNQILEFKKIGIAPEDIYEDSGVSGTVPAKKRKGFKRVYDRILKGEVEELYIFELSRLGRTSSESIMLFIEIEQLGTRIKSLSPNEAWTRATDDQAIRNVYTAMFSWFADIERRNISERTKLGLQRAREQGKHIGRDFKEPDRKEYNKLKVSGLKTAQIARVMQVPASTMYRWVEKWEEEERVRNNEECKQEVRKTTVVNLTKEPYDIYIGRGNPRMKLKASKWGNPFSLPKNATDQQRAESIESYKEYFWKQPELIAAIPELKGKVLGCWCKPLPCHGDFLAELANEET